jgi:hypothetical protein
MTKEELFKFLDRARHGDASTLPALRKMLETPGCVDFLGGNLARQAERSLVEVATGQNLVFKEALLRKLELLRAELAGPDPSPLERLLVERVVACWLQVQDADFRYAQAKNASAEWGKYYQQRMDRAHRRYLSAIKTLALVRKLALPVLLRVNVAREQSDGTGTPAAPAGNGAAAVGHHGNGRHPGNGPAVPTRRPAKTRVSDRAAQLRRPDRRARTSRLPT